MTTCDKLIAMYWQRDEFAPRSAFPCYCEYKLKQLSRKTEKIKEQVAMMNSVKEFFKIALIILAVVLAFFIAEQAVYRISNDRSSAPVTQVSTPVNHKAALAFDK